MATPLTKHSKEGVPYVRPAEVESNIDGALDQETAVLIRRAHVTDRASSEYLSSECLVHLIRAALRSGDDSRFNALLPILLLRCEANLKSTIRRSVPNADQVREDVLGELGVLFASEGGDEPSHELDYYEVRFDHAFRTLRCAVLRRERKSTEGVEVLLDGAEIEDGRGLPANLPTCRATQEDGVHRAELLDRLPHELRHVVILTEMGYVAESEDSNKVTVATLCKVKGRTVRARLKKARQLIQQMRPEES
jgi:hypothetical protein